MTEFIPSGAEPVDRFLTVNGLRLHYLEWGHAARPHLLLLHGFSNHAHFWDLIAQAMRDALHILAPDARGHGLSEWATDYSRRALIQDLDATIHALGLGRVHLVGFSMGGRTAYLYAAQHPARVERLVIVDMGPDLNPEYRARPTAGVLAQEDFDNPEQLFRAARAANPRPSDEDLRNRIGHGLMQRPDGRWTWRYDPVLRAPDRPRRLSDPSAWAALAQITCPTLLVRPTENYVITRATAERMTRSIPDCRLVEIPDSGHSIPTDNPTGFLAAVRPFLTGGLDGFRD